MSGSDQSEGRPRELVGGRRMMRESGAKPGLYRRLRGRVVRGRGERRRRKRDEEDENEEDE
jgi:hypothetical protein